MENQKDFAASFILLSYNQEPYIAQAVRAVLSQNSKPLEIIISDDCSTDRTVNIIEDELKNYSGPHKVIFNKNKTNLGINKHINKVIDLSSCDIIIGSAGDDISYQKRASRILSVFEKQKPLLVHSDYTTVDEFGNTIDGTSSKKALFYRTTNPLEAAKSFGLFVGATVAWHKDIFRKYGPLPENSAYEDLVLGFRASLEDRVSYIDEKLVDYRSGVGESFKGASLKISHSEKQIRLRNLNDQVLEQRIKDAYQFGLDDNSQILRVLKKELIKNKIRKDINEVGYIKTVLGYYKHPKTLLSSVLAEINLKRKSKP